MSKSYIYRVLGNDQYKVIRYDGETKKFAEYHVDLKSSDWMCDCDDFYYRKKCCKHIKSILEELKAGGGILDWQQDGDYDRLIEAEKKW